MVEDGVRPNLGTFNDALSVLGGMNREQSWRAEGEKKALQILQEMGRIGITPSLGTYFHLLNALDHSPQLRLLLYQVVAKLEQVEEAISEGS